MMPATCLLSDRKNEGANCASVTLAVVLPPPVVTTTDTVPVAVSSGACRLIWVGLTYWRYAAFPSIVTVVPPSDPAKFPVHVATALARLAPYIDTHSPGWMVPAVLSTGTMPPGVIVGADWFALMFSFATNALGPELVE